MKRQSVLAIALVFVALFGCASSAFAQAGAATAQLNGTVTDASGGSVAGATVTVRNTATNTTSTATSNDHGYYSFANLAPGEYELKTSFSGFANYTQKGIELSVGQSATINIALAVASQGEKVVVTSEAQGALDTLPAPDAIFIGGGAEPAVIDKAFAALKPGGRIIANAITLETEKAILAAQAELGGTLTRLSVARLDVVGGKQAFRPAMTVTQWSAVKPLVVKL